MPIINFEDENVQLEFGFGDIRIAPGLVGEAGAICFFRMSNPLPIGTHLELPEPIEVPAEDTPVRMVFNELESIDVLINALLDAKRMMKRGRVTNG